MNILSIIKAVLLLLPAIIEAIKAVEELFPDSGNGDTKLSFIREIVKSAYEVVDDLDDFEDLWPFIERAISVVVGFFNKVGLFIKG